MKKALRNIFNCILASMILLGCAATCLAANVPATNVTIHGQTMTYSGTQTTIPIASGNQATDGSADCKFDGTSKFTLTAKNSKYYNWIITKGYAQNYSMKLTLTNSSGSTIKITYTTNNINGVANGQYADITMQDGESLSFTVATSETNSQQNKQNTVTGTVTIDSITTVAGAKVSFVSSSHGSYSAVVGEETVSMASGAETTEDYNVSIGGSITLTAGQAAEGYKFYCWMGGGKQLGTANGSYTINEDMVVYPVYLPEGSETPFTVDGTGYMFWHQALAASKESGKPAILVQNYTLPTTLEANGLCTGHLYGDYVSGTDGNLTYTIPYSSNLLIPYGANDSGSFGAEPQNYITFSEGLALFDKNKLITERNFAYCTLTVPSGAKIDCYGALNPNGQRQPDSQPYSGAKLGGYGKIKLNGSGTQLTVHNGGALYCYGYITGSGMVEILNGGKIHEFLQLCDWTGGSHASNWKSASEENQSLFLLSQYYVQSVEAPVTIRYGARAYCEAVLTGSGLTGTVTKPVSVPYITENKGLFILQDSNSYIVRQYNAEQDRMTYNLYGNIKVGSISVTVTHGISITLSSEEYVLPLPSNMTFIVQNGTTTMDKNVAILPGAKGIISQGAAMNLSGKLYVVDVNDWTNNYFFNRAYFTPNTGFSMVNKTPNTAPLPYVATLNTISPRARAYVRGKDGSTQHYYMDAINATESGKLEVNGTLNITGSGSICTTKQTESIETDTLTSEDVNKVVKGNGFINYESTPAAGTLSAGFNGTITTITTANGYGNLAGVGTLQPFATGDYYGTGDYWYQHIINTEGGSVTVTSTNGAAGSNLSPLDGRKTQNIVARVANGGSITYTIPAGYGVSINDTLQTPDDKDAYTLSNITADTTLVLHEHSYTYSSVEDYSATGTCSVCGSTTTVSVPVSFEAIQLSVEAEVMLRLKITVADDFDGTIILTEAENERTGAPQVAVYTMEELAAVEIDEKGRYVLDQGIAAGEMTGIVSIEAIDANGNTCFISDYTDGSITKKLDRTVLDYAKLALAKGGDEMKELARTMLTFGGYAQAFYEVDIENPAYNILPECGFEQRDINAVTLEFLNEIVDGNVRVPDLSWAPASSTLMMSPPQETEPENTEAAEVTEPDVTEATEPTEPEATEPTAATEPDVTEPTQSSEPEVPETTIAAETEVVETTAVTEQPSEPESILTDTSEIVTKVFNSGKAVEAAPAPISTNFMLDMLSVNNVTETEEVSAETQPEVEETQHKESLTVDTVLPAAEPLNTAVAVSEENFGIAYANAQKINFDARVDMISYFTLSEGAEISDYTFQLTYAKGGKEFTRDISGDDIYPDGDRYAIKIADIPVAYWDFEYVITITKGDTSYELRSSILAWAKRCIASYEAKAATLSDEEMAQVNTAQVNMAKAMYYYNQAANNYFDR